jgi:hypothetical protein
MQGVPNERPQIAVSRAFDQASLPACRVVEHARTATFYDKGYFHFARSRLPQSPRRLPAQ